jgi:hypothetical protein
MAQPVIINVNTLPILPAATSTICAYPLGKIRTDMGIQEYINYKNDWNFFNTVWSYNYTVSTLNGQGNLYHYYQFMSNGDMVSYSNGQNAHFSFYSNAPTSQFNNFY